MSEELLEQVRRGGETAFAELADRYRAELQLHCYRITGSVQDAEDLVQETLLAGWRGLDDYEGRATVRTWLYRIATNRCLNALRDRGRRPREVPMPAEETPPPPPPTRIGEPVWLEPYPDVLLEGLPDRAAQPEARYEAREAIGLAFVTAVQLLPPRQRAVLVLRDVLAFRAREVAEMLGVTEVSANRALQRARHAVERGVPPGRRDLAPLPGAPAERQLVARFTTAFEAGDIAGVVALLTGDAVLTMPPEALRYEGPDAIG
ncbi:MAG: RNA polymerase subunit sigma-70, partial [Streptosporangiaceae bacterium]